MKEIDLFDLLRNRPAFIEWLDSFEPESFVSPPEFDHVSNPIALWIKSVYGHVNPLVLGYKVMCTLPRIEGQPVNYVSIKAPEWIILFDKNMMQDYSHYKASGITVEDCKQFLDSRPKPPEKVAQKPVKPKINTLF